MYEVTRAIEGTLILEALCGFNLMRGIKDHDLSLTKLQYQILHPTTLDRSYHPSHTQVPLPPLTKYLASISIATIS